MTLTSIPAKLIRPANADEKNEGDCILSCNKVCGFDEAGRGCLAGPVFAAAVILDENFPMEILADSKALSPKKREAAEKIILEKSLAHGIGFCTHEEIDEINILQASLLAMNRAFSELQKNFPEARVEIAITDGIFSPKLSSEIRAVALPHGDSLVYPIMAASILAKTARDRKMLEFHELYPQYGYEKHKGYGTKAHKEACKKFGPSPIQRLTFKY